MKEYIVYYGKENARYNIGVYAKNEQEAKEIIEKQKITKRMDIHMYWLKSLILPISWK